MNFSNFTFDHSNFYDDPEIKLPLLNPEILKLINTDGQLTFNRESMTVLNDPNMRMVHKLLTGNAPAEFSASRLVAALNTWLHLINNPPSLRNRSQPTAAMEYLKQHYPELSDKMHDRIVKIATTPN